MIIHSLSIRNFGCLGEQEIQFSPHLNVIRGPNEAGKSTLQAAVLTLLFTKVNSQAEAVSRWQSWQAPEMFRLSAEFTVGGEDWKIVKDFARRDTSLVNLATGVGWSGRDEVQEKLAELVGTRSQAVYESTGAIRQRQVAELGAKGQLGEMIQQSITGRGAPVSVPQILKQLDTVVGDLWRGWERPAPKNPGPLAVVKDEIEQLTNRQQILRSQRGQVEAAQQRQGQCREELEEVEPDIQRRQQVLEKAELRRELEAKLEEGSDQWHQLNDRVQQAERLREEIGQVTSELDSLPPVSDEEAAQVRELAGTMAHTAKEIEGLGGRLNELKTTRQEVETEVSKLAGEQSPAEVMKFALELQDSVTKADASVARLQQQVQQIEHSLQAARSASRRRAATVTGGLVAAVVGGISAGIFSPWWLLLTVAGVLVAIKGAVTRASHPVTALIEEQQQAASGLAAAQQHHDQVSSQLDELLAGTGAQTVAELSSLVAGASDRLVEIQAKLSSAEENLAEAEQQQADAQQQLQRTLGDRFENAETLLQVAEHRAELSRRRDQHQAALKAVLGTDDWEQLDQRRKELALERATIQTQLDSPELAHIDLEPMEVEELRDQIAANRQRRDELKEELIKAQATIESTDYDAEEALRTEEQLAEAQQRLARLERRVQVYELTYEVLQEAYQQTLDGVIGPLEQEVRQMLATMTGGRYRQVRIDNEEFQPIVFSPQKGEEAEDDDLSCATAEQVYLAARLGLIQILWPDEGPPLLLDDPLVNFDDQRRQAAAMLLGELAKDRQILLFTHSEEFDSYADTVLVLPGP